MDKRESLQKQFVDLSDGEKDKRAIAKNKKEFISKVEKSRKEMKQKKDMEQKKRQSQPSKVSNNAPITIEVTNFKETKQLGTEANMKECLKRIRKFTVENLPDSNFLRFLSDKGAKPCVQYLNPIFVITDNVCILVDNNSILFEFSELNNLFVIVRNGSFDEIKNIIEKAMK